MSLGTQSRRQLIKVRNQRDISAARITTQNMDEMNQLQQINNNALIDI